MSLIGGALCLDFTNTVGWRGGPDSDEKLYDYEDLIVWALRVGALSEGQAKQLLQPATLEPARAQEVLEQAVALRESLYRSFSSLSAGTSPRPTDIARINAAVADAYRHLRLAPSGDGFAWQWHETKSALELPVWMVARSAAELLVSPELERVRECAGEKCDWLFLDASRNQSRRWCDMAACGNRAKAQRNYARKRGGGAASRAAKRAGVGRKA